jgi:hypothetical protein
MRWSASRALGGFRRDGARAAERHSANHEPDQQHTNSERRRQHWPERDRRRAELRDWGGEDRRSSFIARTLAIRVLLDRSKRERFGGQPVFPLTLPRHDDFLGERMSVNRSSSCPTPCCARFRKVERVDAPLLEVGRRHARDDV